MKYKNLILAGEAISILATIVISLKLIILEPKCFSLFDGYTTVLPIVLTKSIEVYAIFTTNKG